MGKSSAPAPTPAPAPVVAAAPDPATKPADPSGRAVALRADDQSTKAADTISSGSGDVDPLTQKKQLAGGSSASMMG